MQEYSEKELVRLFKEYNEKEKAFNLIVMRYRERLYRHIRQMVFNHDDTDDILQNTLIKVWKNLDNFREESNLFTWIYRIATNETLTFIRNSRRSRFAPWESVEQTLSHTLVDDEFFSGDAIQKKLQEAVAALPEKQRLVFTMRYFEEMKYEDMSAILSTSTGALKASYHHAVRKIENFMNED
ncbi:MAG TPA: RNA polymerase sigma factor [Bacteroidales bacterium]|nr:RNA polymerase sigma factor [Bacteroidales bacterium]